MKAQIYQPSKTATQSGRAKTQSWILEYELETARVPEPLMGWTSSGDTNNQVKLRFDTREEAEAFAKKKGWVYEVKQAHTRKITPRTYLDNFKYVPPEDEA